MLRTHDGDYLAAIEDQVCVSSEVLSAAGAAGAAPDFVNGFSSPAGRHRGTAAGDRAGAAVERRRCQVGHRRIGWGGGGRAGQAVPHQDPRLLWLDHPVSCIHGYEPKLLFFCVRAASVRSAPFPVASAVRSPSWVMIARLLPLGYGVGLTDD